MFDLEQKVRVPSEDFESKIIKRKFDNGKFFYQLSNEKWYEEKDIEIANSPTLKKVLDFVLQKGIKNETILVELNKMIISIYDGGVKARIEHNKHQYNLLNPKTPLKYREIFKKYKEFINNFDENKDVNLVRYIFAVFEEVKELIICIDGSIIHRYRPKEKEEN